MLSWYLLLSLEEESARVLRSNSMPTLWQARRRRSSSFDPISGGKLSFSAKETLSAIL